MSLDVRLRYITKEQYEKISEKYAEAQVKEEWDDFDWIEDLNEDEKVQIGSETMEQFKKLKDVIVNKNYIDYIKISKFDKLKQDQFDKMICDCDDNDYTYIYLSGGRKLHSLLYEFSCRTITKSDIFEIILTMENDGYGSYPELEELLEKWEYDAKCFYYAD